MSETGVACATCPFFVAVDEKTGYCHRRPPQPFLVPGPPSPISNGQPRVGLQAVWTPVGIADWCGEHPMFGITALVDKRLAAEAEGRG